MIGLLSRRMFVMNGIIRRNICEKPLKIIKDTTKYQAKLMAIQEIVLKTNNKMNGNIDWNQIISELSKQHLVNRVNFEVDLMSAFLLNTETDIQMDQKLFQSMTKYIKSVANVSNNSIIASRYYYFISHFNQYIEDSELEMIRRTTDQLMDKYINNRLTSDVFNPSLIGLSKSSKDNCFHSIKILDQIKVKDFLLIQQIMESAINFGLIDQTLDLIEKYSDISLSELIISKLINCLSERNPKSTQIMKLLENLSKNLIVFDSNLKSKFIKILDNISYKTTDTSVGQNGLCLKCVHRLSGVTIEEQNTLIKDFHSVVFNKESDLMLKTFPEFERELRDFNKFIREITSENPLDLVIDGLNVAFSINPMIVEDKKNLRKFVQKHPIYSIDANLVQTLKQNNIEKYENILIVGRRHMMNWKQLNQLLFDQRKRISIFYTMNKTQDDCYILYATLKNPNTYLISNDLYKDYCEKMSQKGNLFERWLKTHQISISRKQKAESNQCFTFPNHFDHKIDISQNGKTLHIPFHSNILSRIDWICSQKLI